MIDNSVENQRTKLMTDILEESKEGLTKQEMLDKSGLSYQQLRDITAELTDKKFLRYNQSDETYITTDKGYKFLQDMKKETPESSLLSNEAINDQL
jgi:predicted transcriptional regulator